MASSASPQTQSAKFHIKLLNFRIHLEDDFRGRYTPLLKCSWDIKEVFKTAKGTGAREVTFPDVKEFEFETRFFKKLDTRFFVVEIVDSGLVKDTIISEVKMDLLSIICGPMSHQLTISENGTNKRVGYLIFHAYCEEMKDITITLSNLELISPSGLKSGQLEASYLLYMFQVENEAEKKSKKGNKFVNKPFKHPEVGVSKWDKIEMFNYHDMTISTLLSSGVTFQIMFKRGMFGKDIPLCMAGVKIVSALPFTGEAHNFSVPFSGAPFKSDVNGRLTGSIRISNTFKYIQLEKGTRIDKTIRDGFRSEEINNRFKDIVDHQIGDSKSQSTSGIAAPGGGRVASVIGPLVVGGGGGRRPSAANIRVPEGTQSYSAIVVRDPTNSLGDEVKFVVGSEAIDINSPTGKELLCWPYIIIKKWEPKTSALSLIILNSAHPDTPDIFAFSFIDAPAELVSSHITSMCQKVGKRRASVTPGVNVNALNAGEQKNDDHSSKHFEATWRVIRSPSGGNFFTNIITGLDSPHLPITKLYTLVIPDVEGRLGVELVSTLDANETFRGRVSRFAGVDSGAVIVDVIAGGLVDRVGRAQGVAAGHHIIGINGISVEHVPYSQTMEILVGAPRPLYLDIFNPFSVTPEIADRLSLKIHKASPPSADLNLGGRRGSSIARDGIAMLQRSLDTVPELPPAIPEEIKIECLLGCKRVFSFSPPDPNSPKVIIKCPHCGKQYLGTKK